MMMSVVRAAQPLTLSDGGAAKRVTSRPSANNTTLPPVLDTVSPGSMAPRPRMPSMAMSPAGTGSIYFSVTPLNPAAKTSVAWIREKTVFPAAGGLVNGAQAVSSKIANPQKPVNEARQ